jgi:thiol-disulfide isomerase/thioredoxin
VVKSPAGLSEAARYGYNFVVGGKNRGWILDGSDEKGWTLYLDMRGDGDLSAAEPRKLEGTRLDVAVDDWTCRFEIAHLVVEGRPQLGVRIIDGTVRAGVIELDGLRFPFRLQGSRGKYDGEYDRVVVGKDSYKTGDRFLNLSGKSYEFKVDPAGANLTLTELAEKRPDRPTLQPGSKAPTFPALAGLAGRKVLIEFWSTSCGPCRAEAPRMAELYKGLDRSKFEFLGISSDASKETLQAFLDEFKLTWPQVQEPFEGPIHQLYRVDGEPTYFLISPAGEIIDTWMGSGQTAARLK